MYCKPLCIKKILLVCVLFLLNRHFISAQADTIKDIFNISLEQLMNMEVSGASRYRQKASEVPNSMQIITREQIIDNGYKDLSDLLKRIPELDITDHAGRFGELYSFRGITGNDRFLVLINGHKLNPASGTFISIGNSISIKYADRVEIIYGPASAVYGADAFSGIVNIVFEETSIARKDIQISAYSDYGSMNSFDAGFEGQFRVNTNLSFNLNARIYKSDGFDIVGSDPAYDIINNYLPPIKNACEQPKNDHQIYFNTSYKNISINYYRQQFDEGNAMGHNPSIYIFDYENRWKTSTNLIWLTYQKDFTNQGTLSFGLSYKNHQQDNNSAFKKWVVPGELGDVFIQYMTGKDNTLHAVFTYNQVLNEKLRFIVGFDNEYTMSIPPYANDEVLGNSLKYEGANARLINDKLTVRENRFSGFGQVSYIQSDFLSIVLGARYDYSSQYKGVVNPRLGFILSPLKSTTLKFIYGRAFQAPSLFYQYEQFGAPTAAMLSSAEYRQFDPQWKLKNQIVNSYEISLSQIIHKNHEIKINVYYNSLKNLIERKLFAVYPTDSVFNKYFDKYTSGFRNENIGKQKIFGTGIYYTSKISRSLTIQSFYSFTQPVSILSDGSEAEIPRIAKHKAWFSLSIHNMFKYFTISPAFKWSGKIYNLNVSDYPDNYQKGYHSLDLYVHADEFIRFLSFYAGIENITNRKIKHAGLYDQMGVYSSAIPQPGFVFRFGIEIQIKK